MFAFLSAPSAAQEVRSFDGTANNLSSPGYGAVGQQLKRITRVAFADGISVPGGLERMNPREISNRLFDQNTLIPNNLGLSDFVWTFGQFLDHDLSLVANGPELMPIAIPENDDTFDPTGPGIIFLRSDPVPGSGTDPDNPRQYTNEITAWLDASMVYGSDEVRSNWLRTFQGGKLKISAGDLLPYQTLDGEFESPTDRNAPFMANDARRPTKMFVAGDIRANENPLLIAFHTLFVREHNRLATELRLQNPQWDDEQLFQHARRIVIGLIQNITFGEWLPSMGVSLDDYRGYDATINPSISNEFSAAAFRLGHSLVSSNIMRLDEKGEVIPQGNLTLRESFFNPLTIRLGNGLDPLFKGMAVQRQQEFDPKVVDDVRNFLFESSELGGLDLAAINIMRGRERGLPDYNTIREDVGLKRANSFLEICDDPVVVGVLEEIYGSPDNADPWVGMLAEIHMEKALFGETVMAIVKRQFTELRDGDRFYFETDPALSTEERNQIRNTRLSDIIRRNTSISLMQDSVFTAMPHNQIPRASAVVVKRNLDFVIYPNPAEEDLYAKVYISREGQGSIRLFNLLGQEVLFESNLFEKGENDVFLNLNHTLQSGFYLLQIEKDGEVASKVLVKR